MNPKEWRALKEELLNRGLEVKVSGKVKKEYIVSTPYMLVDILRGGITHSGSTIEVVVFSTDDNSIVDSGEFRNIKAVLDMVDHYIAEYNEFGSII